MQFFGFLELWLPSSEPFPQGWFCTHGTELGTTTKPKGEVLFNRSPYDYSYHPDRYGCSQSPKCMFCNKQSSTSVGCMNLAVLLPLHLSLPLPVFNIHEQNILTMQGHMQRYKDVNTEVSRSSYVRIHVLSMVSQALVPPSTNPHLPSQESVYQDIAVTPHCLRHHFLLSIDKQELLK